VNSMFLTTGTEFFQFHPLRFLFVLVRMIISAFTFGAG